MCIRDRYQRRVHGIREFMDAYLELTESYSRTDLTYFECSIPSELNHTMQVYEDSQIQAAVRARCLLRLVNTSDLVLNFTVQFNATLDANVVSERRDAISFAVKRLILTRDVIAVGHEDHDEMEISFANRIFSHFLRDLHNSTFSLTIPGDTEQEDLRLPSSLDDAQQFLAQPKHSLIIDFRCAYILVTNCENNYHTMWIRSFPPSFSHCLAIIKCKDSLTLLLLSLIHI
eukprot:TRINITY_DN3177_c0_g2_i5.p1 TRINITY_DN3177_c0_g2~~TRINITY_DN3177_c0_g2_i5.p1  ORF type:complete len:230 (-),score=25.54 TRINITY_DN3177_c0_g2_i5:63-752(-)